MTNTAEQLDQDDIELVLPNVTERYVLIEKVGEESGFGAVWRARDFWLNRRNVAIKVSDKDLSQEVLLCRDVEGQTVRIFDYFKGEGSWNAYAMEWLEKPWLTLSGWIKTHKYRQHDLQHYFDCFEIIHDALRGLKDIHGRPYSREGRYVHADIKPANMFFLCQPKKRPNSVFRMPAHQDMVKIIDMGVSTESGSLKKGATPEYDYQKTDVSRPGNDLYALGIVFLELLSGDRPSDDIMAHKARIKSFVATCSSGSQYVDDLAVEFARLCARAAAQLTITARSLQDWLDEQLFELNEASLLLLRSIHHHQRGALMKEELASAVFPDMAGYFGWQNQTVGRIAFLKEMIADMYEQGLLVREDGSYRYFVR